MNTGETSHYTETRINEYHYHIQLYQPDKLCTMNFTDLGHQIMTNITNIPLTKSRQLDHLTREATENNVHPKKKRVGRYPLSRPQ